MGVTCVSQVPVAEGKSVQQTVELLARRLEALGADKQGTFGVDCETYHTAATLGTQGQTGKLMYVMHNSEYPLSCFALFENGPCLVADANFDTLMVKLKGFFQNAKANKIESRGTRYQYCDFLVKLGTVTMGPSARGISVEVESRPCEQLQACRAVFPGGILPLCDRQRLLEPADGVHAELHGQPRARHPVGVRLQARRRLQPRGHHGAVHGALQQDPQAAAGARGWHQVRSVPRSSPPCLHQENIQNVPRELFLLGLSRLKAMEMSELCSCAGIPGDSSWAFVNSGCPPRSGILGSVGSVVFLDSVSCREKRNSRRLQPSLKFLFFFIPTLVFCCISSQ
ncbi:mediator of RNA polymerase II transcription subunit 20 isoform X2 [Onychostruthus taczanowskii]|uniref:mediator of RNA polymerase II transcription subunit 20 isoform X2 n=1 Tax=Onychostruthus taczanowskii TaxID=356909 RepID=UPI001B805231|nr:mediator of RNA polymerase II transcription subunit 20 isoform X2 [Onychostruthus taczanowskii]